MGIVRSGVFFLHFFSWLKLQDVTVDEFIDVIDGNRKYCKCGSACRDVISCFLISFHVTTCGKFARLKGIYVYNKHLGILVAAWHCWKLCRKDFFYFVVFVALFPLCAMICCSLLSSGLLCYPVFQHKTV